MELTTKAILRRLASCLLILCVSLSANAEQPAAANGQLTQYEAMLLGEGSPSTELKRLEEVGNTYSRLTLRNVSTPLTVKSPKAKVANPSLPTLKPSSASVSMRPAATLPALPDMAPPVAPDIALPTAPGAEGLEAFYKDALLPAKKSQVVGVVKSPKLKNTTTTGGNAAAKATATQPTVTKPTVAKPAAVKPAAVKPVPMLLEPAKSADVGAISRELTEFSVARKPVRPQAPAPFYAPKSSVPSVALDTPNVAKPVAPAPQPNVQPPSLLAAKPRADQILAPSQQLFDHAGSGAIVPPVANSVVKLAQVPAESYIQPNGLGNHFVPESSLTDSMIMGGGYQPPRLFSHNDYMVETQANGWPCSRCGQNSCNCGGVRWRAQAGAIFLHRSRADGFSDPIMQNLGARRDFASDAISMDMHGGPRFSLIRDNTAGGIDVEGTYYFINEWTGTAHTEGFVSSIGPPPFGTFLGVGEVDARYETALQNAELNLFKDVTNWVQFMVGFRYLQLDEHASIVGAGDAGVFDQRVNAQNDLYGGQIGLRKSVWDRGGFITVDGTVKGGVFHNRIERATTGFGVGPLDKSRTSFVGEVDLDMNYEITQSWSLNLGYQVMWVTHVAEALDQFFSPNEIYDEGNALLHGFRLGLVKTW